MDNLKDIHIGPGPLPAPRSTLHAPKEAWEKSQEADTCFWADEGPWIGFSNHAFMGHRFDPEEQLLEIHCPLGTLQIRGPKAERFWEGFRSRRVTCLKADGDGIESVHLHVPKPKKKEEEF